MYNFSTIDGNTGHYTGRNRITQAELIAALQEFPDGVSAIQLAEKLKITTANASVRLIGLVQNGTVERVRKGMYKLV